VTCGLSSPEAGQPQETGPPPPAAAGGPQCVPDGRLFHAHNTTRMIGMEAVGYNHDRGKDIIFFIIIIILYFFSFFTAIRYKRTSTWSGHTIAI